MSDLPKCDDADCAGHLGKFDSCRAEAVYSWAMDGAADESTGDSDYEGHFSLFIVTEPTGGDVDGRVVLVPAGNYILHSATSGAVSLWTYDTPEAARAVYEAAQKAYDTWDQV